jgi:hypothetical protein
MQDDVASGSTLADSPSAQKGEKTTVISFEDDVDDPENPFNWKSHQKIMACSLAFFFSLLTAANCAGYSAAFGTMLPELHTDRL